MRNDKSPYSPYANTNINGFFMDIWVPIRFPPSSTDLFITLQPRHQYRPDVLSQELYGTEEYWWIFAVRNKNTLIDPINDFMAGVRIYAPAKIG
jgi:hypothetical protein